VRTSENTRLIASASMDITLRDYDRTVACNLGEYKDITACLLTKVGQCRMPERVGHKSFHARID
jgi:hypothetical protein